LTNLISTLKYNPRADIKTKLNKLHNEFVRRTEYETDITWKKIINNYIVGNMKIDPKTLKANLKALASKTNEEYGSDILDEEHFEKIVFSQNKK
jgi:hypothetical protein